MGGSQGCDMDHSFQSVYFCSQMESFGKLFRFFNSAQSG